MSSFWNQITVIPLHLIEYSSKALLSSQKAASLTVLMQMQVYMDSEVEIWPASGKQEAYSWIAIHHDPAAESYTASVRSEPLSHKRERRLGRDRTVRERARKPTTSGWEKGAM